MTPPMELVISYTDLKETANQVIDLVCKIGGLDHAEVSISSAVNYDLGIDGDDWWDLSNALDKELGIKLDGLEFSKHFHGEAEISDPIGVIVWLIHLILFIVSFQWLKTKFSDFYESGPDKEPLTLGDIIASKYAGRFVRRSERRFVLA